eukprot:1312336-Pleurochrysis_carterae.AAC.4
MGYAHELPKEAHGRGDVGRFTLSQRPPTTTPPSVAARTSPASGCCTLKSLTASPTFTSAASTASAIAGFPYRELSLRA